MLTRAESTYLALTLAFLAAGFGLKTWSRTAARVGPFPDAATMAQDSARASDSLASAAAPPAGPDAASAGSGIRPEGSDPGADRGAGDPNAAARSAPQDRPRKSDAGAAGKIDLNRADAAGLMRMKGIGAKTAEAILAYRRTHGPFRDLRDLLQIKGIGEKKLEKLAPQIIL